MPSYLLVDHGEKLIICKLVVIKNDFSFLFFQAAEAFLVRLFEDAYHSACLLLLNFILMFCCCVFLFHVVQYRPEFCFSQTGCCKGHLFECNITRQTTRKKK